MTETLSITAAIERVLAGHTRAYAQVVNHYHPMVRQVVSAILRDQSATEDLVQQVFINAFRHLGRFDQSRDFGHWIAAIARNTARQELRSRSRYGAHLKAYGDLLITRLSEQSAEASDEQLQWLRACVADLPPQTSHLLSLRYQQGQAISQIAEQVGRKDQTVRNTLSLARKQLRACIESKRGGQ